MKINKKLPVILHTNNINKRKVTHHKYIQLIKTTKTVKTGVKRKETFEEKQAKGNAKRSRIATPTSKTQITVCSSCKNSGHTSARSKDCPNHDPTLNELIQTKLGNNHQRYTVSLPLKSFFKKENESSFENSLLKIKALSSFLRDVTFKAQVFVNYYILKHSKDLSNDIFKQKFWYSVCRVVYKKLSVENFQKQYSKMPSLADTWNELNNREGVKLTVAMDGISNYGQVISTACETISTSYNSYYIEHFQNITANYFIYVISNAFPVSVKIKIE